MIELTIAAHEMNFDYLDWFQESLKVNGYSLRRIDPISDRVHLGVIDYKGKRVMIEWGDSVAELPEEVADCDVLLQANLSSEIFNGMDLKDYPQNYVDQSRLLYSKYHSRIRPFVLGRKKVEGITQPISNPNKVCSIVSFSYKREKDNNYSLHRESFYKFAYETIGDNFQLAYPGYPAERFCHILGAYPDYLTFLSQGYFVLNLIGWMGSNAFRCIDACLAGSCVISDQILADAYKDFPAVMVSGSFYHGDYDWDSLRATLQAVAADPRAIFDDLYPKQLEWYRKNLSMENHCWQVLKHFYNQGS